MAFLARMGGLARTGGRVRQICGICWSTSAASHWRLRCGAHEFLGKNISRDCESESQALRQRLAKDIWCAVKGAGPQRVQIPPRNWFAPAGSNRNSGGVISLF
jgi:hypothetical protein